MNSSRYPDARDGPRRAGRALLPSVPGRPAISLHGPCPAPGAGRFRGLKSPAVAGTAGGTPLTGRAHGSHDPCAPAGIWRTPLDAIAPVEVEHHGQRHPGVPAQHVNEGRALPRGDRGKGVRKELLAPEPTALPVKTAGEMRLALIVERTELGRVRLPLSRGGVQVIERVPDLMTHHVGCR